MATAPLLTLDGWLMVKGGEKKARMAHQELASNMLDSS